MNELPNNQNPRLHDFETGRSQRRNPGDKSPKKARRVSQRRELAVVTLGAVASIAGLGGFLAANPPSWATPPEKAAPETTVAAEAVSDEGALQRYAGSDSSPASIEPAPIQEQDARSETPAEKAPPPPSASTQAPVEEAAPAWSAPSRAPAAAESRGS